MNPLSGRHSIFKGRQFEPDYVKPIKPEQLPKVNQHNYKELTEMLGIEIKQARLDSYLRGDEQDSK